MIGGRRPGTGKKILCRGAQQGRETATGPRSLLRVREGSSTAHREEAVRVGSAVSRKEVPRVAAATAAVEGGRGNCVLSHCTGDRRQEPSSLSVRTLIADGRRLHPWDSLLAIDGRGEKRRRNRRGKKRRRGVEDAPVKRGSAGGSSSFSSQEWRQQPSPKSKRLKQINEAGAKPATSSRLLDKMRARLSGGHFRMLNEKLYTCSGHEAFNLFKKDPELFNEYHAGYQQQMSHWPEQPINVIIKWLKDHSPSLIVADFGCGNACLAKNVKNKVLSIDLVSSDPSVIACDMAHTPLDSASVDVAVFCLSLMGTDFPNYILEANRVLKPRGWLLIAEVRSRFDPNNGGADPDKFIEAVQRLGFSSISKDFSNKMFILFYFKKKEKGSGVKDIKWPQLKPCLYKRR